MAVNLDSPPIYDPILKKGTENLHPFWQEWLATFFQSVQQKLFITTVVTTSQTMQITNRYFANGSGLVTLTLPLTSDVGDEIEVAAINANGWLIAQNTGQQIQVRNTTTTLGTGGSLASTAIGDAARICCTVANTKWILLSHEGTLSVT